MKDDTYNGWTNYETWNWKLWLDNDESLMEYWADKAREVAGTEYTLPYEWDTQDKLRIRTLAADLETDCDERVEIFTDYTTAGPFHDILNDGLARINWREIAESMLTAITEEVPS